MCSYGVKNNSEVMVMLSGEDTAGDSDSGEEIVVVGMDGGGDTEGGPRERRSRPRNTKEDRPSNSTPTTGLEVPHRVGDRRSVSASRTQSPASGVSGTSSSTVVPGGPIDKMNGIFSQFTKELLPQCEQFAASPPSDEKKRRDEHAKLSETVFAQVLLKLDEIETGGDDQARARRRELVRQVQKVLTRVDDTVKG